MAKKKVSSWRSLFGCFVRIEQIPRPRKQITKQTSRRRLSSSDIDNSSPMSPEDLSLSLVGSNLYAFTLAELKVVTQNFSKSNFLGEGGFGPVYKGFINDKLRPGLKAQSVAVKLLDQEGSQGHKEWLAEVIFLGQLRHPHLVKLIGYCFENEHRLLVYEFMARGSLENHLFKSYFTPLPWLTRMKIAVGAAKGLAFLHEAEKPVIYRDFKASNILLDSDSKAKLSDFGLAKDGPEGDDTHVSTRVMGTHGYAAPEYIMTGHLTARSDVYSFGVVLLELLTGRHSVDKTRPSREQNLVDWAKPWLNDTRKLNRIIDPRLEGQYSFKGAQKAAALAYQCLSNKPKSRPQMATIVEILEPLQYLDDDIPPCLFVYTVKAETVKEDKVEEKKIGKTDNEDEKFGKTDNEEEEIDKEDNVEKKEPDEIKDQHQSRQKLWSLKATDYPDLALYKNGLYRNSPRRHHGRGA